MRNFWADMFEWENFAYVSVLRNLSFLTKRQLTVFFLYIPLAPHIVFTAWFHHYSGPPHNSSKKLFNFGLTPHWRRCGFCLSWYINITGTCDGKKILRESFDTAVCWRVAYRNTTHAKVWAVLHHRILRHPLFVVSPISEGNWTNCSMSPV